MLLVLLPTFLAVISRSTSTRVELSANVERMAGVENKIIIADDIRKLCDDGYARMDTVWTKYRDSKKIDDDSPDRAI